MDHLLRLAVGNGLDPITAIQMATLNIAEAYGLSDRGAITPGRRADLVVCSDLHDIRAEEVWTQGTVVARGGRPKGTWSDPKPDPGPVCRPLSVMPSEVDLRIPDPGTAVRVIGLVAGQIVTDHRVETLPSHAGELVPNAEKGIVKLAVIERHLSTGNVGLGFLQGLGLAHGAMASTVAHDHHNLIVAGGDDRSMRTAIEEVVALGGGAVVTSGNEVLARLQLPFAGLMADGAMPEVRGALERITAAAKEVGCSHPDPLMALSFVALEVIPSLKLTDRGLVDVERFEFVPLSVTDGGG
jgi:adenine deaminase